MNKTTSENKVQIQIFHIGEVGLNVKSLLFILDLKNTHQTRGTREAEAIQIDKVHASKCEHTRQWNSPPLKDATLTDRESMKVETLCISNFGQTIQ